MVSDSGSPASVKPQHSANAGTPSVLKAEVMPRALEIAREIAGCAPIAVRWTKKSLYRNYGWDPVSAAEGEAHAQSRTFETEDSKEGVAALLEKRAPVFKGR